MSERTAKAVVAEMFRRQHAGDDMGRREQGLATEDEAS